MLFLGVSRTSFRSTEGAKDWVEVREDNCVPPTKILDPPLNMRQITEEGFERPQVVHSNWLHLYACVISCWYPFFTYRESDEDGCSCLNVSPVSRREMFGEYKRRGHEQNTATDTGQHAVCQEQPAG